MFKRPDDFFKILFALLSEGNLLPYQCGDQYFGPHKWFWKNFYKNFGLVILRDLSFSLEEWNRKNILFSEENIVLCFSLFFFLGSAGERSNNKIVGEIEDILKLLEESSKLTIFSNFEKQKELFENFVKIASLLEKSQNPEHRAYGENFLGEILGIFSKFKVLDEDMLENTFSSDY